MSDRAKVYDEVLKEIGGFGCWQQWIFFLVSLVALASALPNVSQSFMLYESRFRCVVPNCDLQKEDSPFKSTHNAYTIPYWDPDEDPDDSDQKEEASCTYFKYVGSSDTCNETDFDDDKSAICSSHIYDDSDYKFSFITDLDLGTCQGEDPDWPLYPVITRNSLLGLAFPAGMLIGASLNGKLSDVYGRLNIMHLNNFMSFVTMFVSSFIRNYWAFFVLRILSGVFSFAFASAFMVSVEFVSMKYRMYLGVLIHAPFAVGEMVVALFAFLFQDWRDLQMALSFLCLACLAVYFFIPESPRFLLAEGKIEEAKKVFEKGAKVNKKTISKSLMDKLDKEAEASKSEQGEQLGFNSLFHDWTISVITLIMWINWIVTTLSYYGLGFSSVNLSGDIFVSFFLSALIEIPSYLFCALVLDNLGRKSVLMFSQFLAGICCILAGVVENDTLTTVFSLAGKFGASACFGVIYQYTAELYPTQVRTTAVGSSSMAGRIGSVAAPILIVIEPSSIPLVIMGVSGLIGGTLAMFLPETLGMPFPERLDEIKSLYKNKKKWYKWMTRKDLRELEEAQRRIL